MTIDNLSVTTLNGLTTTELAQIVNINSVSISNGQWGYLGNLNQDLNSSSAVTFSNVLLGGAQSANVAACTRRDYVDSISYITAGTGISKSGSTLSINSSQTQITSIGILTSLTSSGIVNVTNTTVSTSTTTGSLTVAGGVGIVGSVFVGGKISATTATLSTELITKGSVDTLVGLRVLQSAYDTQVSTFNTDISARLLTSTYNSFLTTNQAALDTKATISYVDTQVGLRVLTSTYNSFLTMNQTALDTKATITYVDGTIVTAGTGLTKTGTVFSVNASQTV